MKAGQKISVWCIYFGFFIINCSNIHIQWYCYPTPFPHHKKDIYQSVGWAFLFPFIRSLCSFLSTTWSQLFPCCGPLSKHVAAKILHGNEFTLYNHDQCRILSYKLMHHIQWFSDYLWCVCMFIQKHTHTHSQHKIIFMIHEIRCSSNSNSKLAFSFCCRNSDWCLHFEQHVQWNCTSNSNEIPHWRWGDAWPIIHYITLTLIWPYLVRELDLFPLWCGDLLLAFRLLDPWSPDLTLKQNQY